MKISTFKSLIKELPYKQQGFEIKRNVWKLLPNQELVDRIFDSVSKEVEAITLNRSEVFNSSTTQELVIKALMWGYPTKGRGRNIENLLKTENFNMLVSLLAKYRDKEITLIQLEQDIKSIDGLGLSTMTKFTYFLNSSMNGHLALILDLQIMSVINSGKFEELSSLKGINYQKGVKMYPDYLSVMDKISKDLNVESGQLEYFLFTFGNQLTELK